jgi:hypothetical protein
MTWSVLKRDEFNVIWQNDDNPNQRYIGMARAPLHMQSREGEGAKDTPIDFSFRRVNNASLNGFACTGGPFHFAVQTESATGIQEPRGTIAYGGKRGKNYLKMEVAGIGYLSIDQGAPQFQTLRGAPDFSNFEAKVNEAEFGPPGYRQKYKKSASATWSDIWTTPGGGTVDYHLSLSARGLNQKFILNQEARDALPKPQTPANQTWFGLLFRLDPGEIKFKRGQGKATDLDDEENVFELVNASDETLGYLQKGEMFVGRRHPPRS